MSSSGHLELAKVIFDSDFNTKESLLMTVVLHFATALSTIVIFRKEVGQIFLGIFSRTDNSKRLFALKIIISMLPAAVVGVLWNDLIELFFSDQVFLVGIMLIVTAVVLYFADKSKPTNVDVSYLNSFIIGATIATSVLLGVDKESAAKFSFLMVVPLIFGKITKDIFSGEFITSSLDVTGLGLGFLCAFFTGLLACKLMISIVKRSKLIYFSFYCTIVGLTSIVYALFWM